MTPDRHESLERLQAMIADKGQTWDLSPNDVAALKVAAAALSRVPKLVAALRTAREALRPGDTRNVDRAALAVMGALEGVDE